MVHIRNRVVVWSTNVSKEIGNGILIQSNVLCYKWQLLTYINDLQYAYFNEFYGISVRVRKRKKKRNSLFIKIYLLVAIVDKMSEKAKKAGPRFTPRRTKRNSKTEASRRAVPFWTKPVSPSEGNRQNRVADKNITHIHQSILLVIMKGSTEIKASSLFTLALSMQMNQINFIRQYD